MNIGYIKQEEKSFKMIDKIKRVLCMTTVSEIDQDYIFGIPIFEKEKKMNRVLQRFERQIQKAKVRSLVFSEDLAKSDFYSKIEQVLTQKRYQILNGRKLMNDMNYDIWKYILNLQKADIKQEDIFFLIKKDDTLDLQFLSRFIGNCRTINIITNDIDRFKKLQENLYEKEDILISVSNNKTKSLRRAKYIFNVNMEKKDIEKFKINREAIIVNFKENIRYENNTFGGININYFQISLPDEYNERFERIGRLEEFDNVKLYESILSKRVKMEKKKSIILSKSELAKQKNIVLDMIKKDDIKVVGLIGNNGRIEENEIIRNRQKVI